MQSTACSWLFFFLDIFFLPAVDLEWRCLLSKYLAGAGCGAWVEAVGWTLIAVFRDSDILPLKTKKSSQRKQVGTKNLHYAQQEHGNHGTCCSNSYKHVILYVPVYVLFVWLGLFSLIILRVFICCSIRKKRNCFPTYFFFRGGLSRFPGSICSACLLRFTEFIIPQNLIGVWRRELHRCLCASLEWAVL